MIPEVHFLKYGIRTSRQAPYISDYKISKEEVIYAGPMISRYGHFLTESLARLWFARQRPELPIVWDWSNLKNRHFLQYQSDIFAMLGITNTHIFLNKPTQFKTLHVPEPGFTLGGFFHPDHANFLGVHEKEVISGKFVYISRSKIKSRGCCNECDIEKMLQNHGWTIFHPQELSVKKQLDALSTAEVCLMIAGSAQHSLLLLNNVKTRFVILPRAHHTTYNLIQSCKADNYYLLNISKTILRKEDVLTADLFMLDVDELEHIVTKTNNFTLNLELFKDVLVKNQKLTDNRYYEVPELLYTCNTSVELAIRLFYLSQHYAKQGKMKEACRLIKYMKSRKIEKEYMEKRNSDILRFDTENVMKIEEGHGKKCDLDILKKQYIGEGASQRLNILSSLNDAQRYLEIGVNSGKTFFRIQIKEKSAVDPNFRFDIEEKEEIGSKFYPITSDHFFSKLKESEDGKITFDLIYIDGLHTFEQAMKDFKNSLAHSHDTTIWLLDDTVPSNMFTALASREKANMLKRKAGLSKDRAWYGDVYKVVFAIHDFYPDFSYCTNGTQTVAWRTKQHRNITPVFSSYENIDALGYEGFFENSHLLNFVSEVDFYDLVFTDLNIKEIQAKHDKSRIVKRIITDRERELEGTVKALNAEIEKLKAETKEDTNSGA